MKKTFGLLLLLVSLQTFAQERYRVEFDYATENISYYHLNKNNRIDDTLAKPKFKRNGLIEIKLKNVNPFAVDVVTKLKEEDIHNSSKDFNFSSLLGSLGGLSNTGLTGLSPNLVLGDGDEESRGNILKSDVSNVSAYLKDFNHDVIEVAALKNKLAADLTNPNITKAEIEKNVERFIKKRVEAEDRDDNLTEYLGKRLNKIVSEKKIIESNINKPGAMGSVSRGALSENKSNQVDYDQIQKTLQALSRSLSETKSNINQIQNLYNMLAASSFEKTFDYQLEADKADFEMKFVQSALSADVDNDNERNTLKTRNIKMFAKGGFKINSSIGLTLNSFGNKSLDYYIDPDTNVIRADTNNYFTPNLATMINFYPVIGENFNLGGMFGLSIPITGDLRGVNILFGPSLFLGSRNRLSISGGVVYGPVKKLIKGQELNKETTQTDLTTFTKNVYTTGYFLGISFSIFDLNK